MMLPLWSFSLTRPFTSRCVSVTSAYSASLGGKPAAAVNKLAVFRKEDVARLDSQNAVTIAVAGESSQSCSARSHRQVQWWGVQAVRVARSGSIFRIVAQPTLDRRDWKAPTVSRHPY